MKTKKTEQVTTLLKIILDKVESIEALMGQMNCETGKNEELLTVNQASELLNLSVSTLYSKVCRNEVPVNKVGKRLYFYRSELMQWIKSGRIRTSTEIQAEVESRFKNKNKHS